MKVVITGSNGFVGRRLVRRLEGEGMSVVGLDATHGWDLLDWERLSTLPSFDGLVHLAALSFVPASFEDPRTFLTNNFLATLHALELCRLRRARCIYASSYVYGVPTRLPIDETHPVCAHNPYAQSKLMGEDLAASYWRDFGVSTCIFRVFNLFGPGQDPRFLIPAILRQAASGHIELEDPEPRRDYLYVDDMVEAYRASLVTPLSGLNRFNIGSGKSFSVRDVAARAAKHFSPQPTITFSGRRRKNDILETVADITAARKAFHWGPAVSFEEGLARCVKEQGEDGKA